MWYFARKYNDEKYSMCFSFRLKSIDFESVSLCPWLFDHFSEKFVSLRKILSKNDIAQKSKNREYKKWGAPAPFRYAPDLLLKDRYYQFETILI